MHDFLVKQHKQSYELYWTSFSQIIAWHNDVDLHCNPIFNDCGRVACAKYYGHGGFLLLISRLCMPHTVMCAFLRKYLVDYFDDSMPHSFTCAFIWEHLVEYFNDMLETSTNLNTCLRIFQCVKHVTWINLFDIMCIKRVHLHEFEGSKRLVFDPGGFVKFIGNQTKGNQSLFLHFIQLICVL